MYRTQAVKQAELGESYSNPPAIVGSFRWAFLGALASFILGSLVWSVLARVPESVESMGILLHRSGVSQILAITSGEVLQIYVERGREVVKGDILAELKLPQLESELHLAKEKLSTLEDLDKELQQLEGTQFKAEERMSLLKKDSTKLAMGTINAFAAKARTATERGFTQQKDAISELLAIWRKRIEELTKQLESAQKLLTSQLMTRVDLSTIEGQLVSAKQAIAQLEQQSQSLELQYVELERADLELSERIAEFGISEQEIDLSMKRLRSEKEAQRARNRIQVDSQKQLVDQLSLQLERLKFVRATQAGRLLELPIAVGQPISPGVLMGVVSREPEDGDETLLLTAFFPMAQGKRIARGQEAYITPSTLEWQRHGSIRGTIRDQYEYPMSTQEALRLVGNIDLIAPLSGKGGMLGVHISLNRDIRNGEYQWTASPPDVGISVGTTAKVRVVVERRPPISFLFPALRELFYGPEKMPKRGAVL